MTMSQTELMEAVASELSDATMAAVLRQMVQTAVYIRRARGPELPTAQEFIIAASHVEGARQMLDRIEAQAWDEEHVAAYLIKHGGTPTGDAWEDKTAARAILWAEGAAA